jgi:hypothetical protein
VISIKTLAVVCLLLAGMQIPRSVMEAQAIRLLVRDELNDDERQAGSWGLPGLSGDTYEVQLPAR